MKNLLVLLALVMVAAPAMAVTISATAADQDVTVSYALADGETGLRGVALTIDLVGGTLQSTDDIVALNSEFNAYIDYYVTNGVGETLPGDGAHPLCDPSAAGVATLPASTFGICMGYLDEDGDETLGEPAPGADTDLITFTVTCDEGAESVAVMAALDDLRGGIVGDDLVEVIVPEEALVDVACGPAEPECWGTACFIKGDANGDGIVDATDIGILVPAFNTSVGTAGYNPCADFNKDGIVDAADIGMLVPNFNTSCQ